MAVRVLFSPLRAGLASLHDGALVCRTKSRSARRHEGLPTARAMSTAPITLLFTDLVGSTELLQRAGDEQTQRILRAHHLALQRAVATHAGSEVKWLGDGLMSVFASPADAVRCAVAMQQVARGRV